MAEAATEEVAAAVVVVPPVVVVVVDRLVVEAAEAPVFEVAPRVAVAAVAVTVAVVVTVEAALGAATAGAIGAETVVVVGSGEVTAVVVVDAVDLLWLAITRSKPLRISQTLRQPSPNPAPRSLQGLPLSESGGHRYQVLRASH